MPRQCSATSKRGGGRCKRWALPGQLVCWSHGAAGGVNNVADSTAVALERGNQRLNLAKFLKSDTRPIGVIVTEAYHSVDAYARALKEQAEEQDYVDPELAERLAAAAQVVTMLGVTIQKLGLDARKVLIQEREQEAIIAALRAIAADQRLALTQDQRRAWDYVVPDHLKAITAKAEVASS